MTKYLTKKEIAPCTEAWLNMLLRTLWNVKQANCRQESHGSTYEVPAVVNPDICKIAMVGSRSRHELQVHTMRHCDDSW